MGWSKVQAVPTKQSKQKTESVFLGDIVVGLAAKGHQVSQSLLEAAEFKTHNQTLAIKRPTNHHPPKPFASPPPVP